MPELKARLHADLNVAMKARDELTTATLRMALTAVTTEEVAGKQARELSDDEVLKVLAREGKKRRVAAEAYDAANVLLNGILEGARDRAALKDYVEGLTAVDYAISKEVVFAENGNIEAQGIFIFKVEDGSIVLEVATDDL